MKMCDDLLKIMQNVIATVSTYGSNMIKGIQTPGFITR